jgi:alkanesulfonate monooxygenase SsuD/methylene tetrahydromethanopterin reductase-like flavin-dependent oxidoreductase (luciferase family)
MQIGIGIPNTVVGTTGREIREWSRAAEKAGFSTLGTIGRVAYPNYDSLIVLTAAGAVTERIGLMSDVLLGPTYRPVMLAKMAASADQLTDGRLVLGVGVGARKDDFALVGVPFEERGRRWDEALELMHRAWRGEPIDPSPVPITPPPVNGHSVPLMFGGQSDAAIRRVVKWGIGWTAGGGSPQTAAEMAERVRTAWREGGREGQPKIAALTYFAVGPRAEEHIQAYVVDGYYKFTGEFAPKIAGAVARDAQSLRERAQAYRDVGIDELIFFPTAASLDQVEGLAEAVL